MLNYREEYLKCYNDKTRIYFITNYLSTFNADEGKMTPFRLFPRQQEFLKQLVNGNKVVAIKHRQAGITTVAAAWAAAQCLFADEGAPETVLCIGNKMDISEQLRTKVLDFLNQIPRWMWGGQFYSPDPTSPKNTKSIFVKSKEGYLELFNGCKIYARSSGENAARGISAVSILILDEAAFINNGVSVYSQAVAAMSSVKNKKVVMVSTPNGKDELYYKTYKQALDGQNGFIPVEFRWFQDLRYNRNLKWWKRDEESNKIQWEVEKTIDDRGSIVYDEERWRALEKDGWHPTSPWFEEMCKTLNNEPRKIAQELEVSFLGSADTVVSQEVIEYHTNNNVIEITQDWELRDPLMPDTWIWKDPQKGHRYLMSIDPSSGSSEDSTALEIIDIDAVDGNGTPYFEQVLEYNGKVTGDILGELAYRYGMIYNQALIVVECIGGYGDAVVLTLMRKKYPQLYYDDSSLKNYTINDENTAVKYGNEEDLPGFRTSSLRIQMIGNFTELLRNNVFRIRSMRVINELHTWIWKGARPDHMSGYHDDTLTCLAMGLFIVQFYMLQREKDKVYSDAILKSWMRSGQDASNDQKKSNEIRNKYGLPFYSESSVNRQKDLMGNPASWLIGLMSTTANLKS